MNEMSGIYREIFHLKFGQNTGHLPQKSSRPARLMHLAPRTMLWAYVREVSDVGRLDPCVRRFSMCLGAQNCVSRAFECTMCSEMHVFFCLFGCLLPYKTSLNLGT